LSNGIIWFTTVDVNFTDGFFMAGDMDPVDYSDGFEKVNIRTGLRGDNWDLMLYGKNVTDEITPQGAFDVPLAAGSHARNMTPGEVWGMRFSFSF
jgi:iron complex outermembrane receptor protein